MLLLADGPQGHITAGVPYPACTAQAHPPSTPHTHPKHTPLLKESCVQGLYEVKFVVDGQWRTAPDWPTVHTPHGANNVLQVE